MARLKWYPWLGRLCRFPFGRSRCCVSPFTDGVEPCRTAQLFQLFFCKTASPSAINLPCMPPGIGACIHFLISADLCASLMLRTREFGWLAPNMPWCISPKSNRGWCSRRLRYLRLMCPRSGFLHAKIFKWIETLLCRAQNQLLPRQDRIFIMNHEIWMEEN